MKWLSKNYSNRVLILYKKNKQAISFGAIFFLGGGITDILLRRSLPFSANNLGSLVEWMTLATAIIALMQAYRFFNSEGSASGKVFVSSRPIRTRGEDGIICISSKKELVLWVTNIGRKAGSFKFLGFAESVSESELKELLDKRELPEIVDPDFEYTVGEKLRAFEPVNPGFVSSEITIPLEQVSRQYKNGRELKEALKIHAYFVDQLGKISRAGIIISP